MARNDGEERTEEPTPKRLREAREKGQVPRSRELNTLFMLTGAAAVLLVLGPFMGGRLARLFHAGFELERERLMDPTVLVDRLAALIGQGLLLSAPLFAVLLVAAVAGPLALGGWNFSTKALAVRLERLDPIKGLGRIFSVKGLMELAKTLAKFLLVAAVSVAILWSEIDQLPALGREPLPAALAHAGWLCLWSFLLISASLILVAAIDVPFQLWQHRSQLRMTRKEIRDEQKETEGSPEVKGRIRAIQREMAQRRMMEAVPKADVVVTNPTHYAVALAYDAEGQGAPRVVAKGVDHLALRIRALAAEHGVPVVEAPPLARALHALVDLDQEIPARLYKAVALVLAWVYQLDAARHGHRPPPPPPEDLPVPEEFK